jgi:pseudouridine synthase
MTNDGVLAHRLTHPRYGHEKVYDVTVKGHISDRALDQWRRGVMLDGRITAPAPIEVIKRGRESTRLRVVLREGRKRQIRRIAAALGHSVQRLIRERIGPVTLGDLQPGQWRYLTEREVVSLRQSATEEPAARGPARAAGRGKSSDNARPKREPRAAKSTA